MEDFILNDAGIQITPGLSEILQKGLSFIPTSTPNTQSNSTSLERLRRTLNISLHWRLHENPTQRKSLVSRHWNTGWNPPQYFQHTLAWDEALAALNKKTQHPENISSNGRKALKDLEKATDFYVMKADKGGKTVTWSRENYLKEAKRQLSDPNVYVELDANAVTDTLNQIRHERDALANLLLLGKHITPTDHKNFQERPAKASAIYFLPKIHKDKRADTGTFPGRPILAAMASTTKDIDLFLSFLTAPLLQRIPGSLQDTTALINDLEALDNLPTSSLLFSADVVNLYPSIPWTEGITSATKFYAKNHHILSQRATETNTLQPPSPRLFKQLLTLVITRNVLHLQNSNWYQQISGTAMGCSISVYFANTFMFYRTEKLVRNPPEDLLYFGRYIDDLIGIWKGNKEDIIPTLNTITDEALALTFVISDAPLEALDLKLTLINGRVNCELFRKPTEGHQYVHHTSMHPPALLKSIPFSQLLRIRRNATQTNNFDVEAARLLERLLKRGYPKKLLTRAFSRAILVRRSQLLRKKAKTKDTNRPTIVVRYNNKQRNTSRAIHSLYKHLQPLFAEYNSRLAKPLPLEIPRIAYSINRRLGDRLGIQYKQGPRAV